MNNADFWESINGIVADGFTPEGLQRLDHYAELLINGRLVYKRFSPFEQHGCAAGGTTHVVASILAGAETAPDRDAASDGGDFKRELQRGAQQSACIERWARAVGCWTERVDDSLPKMLGDQIAEGGLDAIGHAIGSNDTLLEKADLLYKQSLDQVNNRVLQENDLDCIMSNGFAKDVFGHSIEGIPSRMKTGVKLNNDQFKDMMNSMLFDFSQGDEPDVYFYHSDHLGSASWITDSRGVAVQHIQYLPYGEPYVNQHPFGYSERFTFTGKERDEETGYGYFGARYYDANLLTGFVSVDRFSDKYPSISPYNYCLWNPTILLDPSGDSVVVKGNEADKYMKNIQSLHLRVERNAKSGVLSASIKGRYNKCDLSDYERQLYDAIGSASCRIEITASKTERRNTQNVFLWEDGTEYSTNLGGSNMGTEYDNTTNTAVARAFVDPDLLANNGFEQGEAHEAIEGYICASIAINEKKDIPLAKQVPGKSGTNSDIEKACRQSVSAMVHPGDIYQFGTKSGRIK